jgi:hypothetical protein
MKSKMFCVLILLAAALTSLIQAVDCINLPLTPQDWQQGEARYGRLEQISNGLLVRGDNWTNARMQNGRIDGNHVLSASQFDLRGGGDVYVVFGVDGGGKYMAIYPKIFSGVNVPHMTTHHSFAGSVILPEKQWLYAHLQVAPAGNYQLTVCQGNYDNQGGQALLNRTGTLSALTGRVEMAFADNYAGPGAYLVIQKALVCPTGGGGLAGGGGGGGGLRGSGFGSVFTAGGGGNQAAAVWYVGTRSSKYRAGRVYCAIAADGVAASASGTLLQAGFPHIAYGPATFDQCVAWVESSTDRWWPVSEEWYVGARSETDGTTKYALACDSGDGPASYKLTSTGYTSILYGPGTYKDCADWLAARGVTGF